MPTALRVLLVVAFGAALSGLVAFLGNKLGRYVGRRKMSVFGLRPRYTSNLITVWTGALIFLVTLGVMSAASREVRLALTGFAELQKQKEVLDHQIADLNRKFTVGPIVLPFDPLSLGVLQCGLSRRTTQEHLQTLIQLANDHLLTRNNLMGSKNNLPPLSEDTQIVQSPNTRAVIADCTQLPRGSTVVCVIVNGPNTVYYDDVAQIQFILRANPIVFHKGQVIVAKIIDGRRTTAQVFNQIDEFIYKDLQYTCLDQYHMYRNPLTDKLDTSIDVGMMRAAADKIAASNRPMRLEVIANGDIHPLGPLDARLVVSPP